MFKIGLSSIPAHSFTEEEGQEMGAVVIGESKRGLGQARQEIVTLACQ